MRRSYRPRRERRRWPVEQATSIAERTAEAVWRRHGDFDLRIQAWFDTYDVSLQELGEGYVADNT